MYTSDINATYLFHNSDHVLKNLASLLNNGVYSHLLATIYITLYYVVRTFIFLAQ